MQDKMDKDARGNNTFAPPDYETKTQVARRLGVSERTIEAMVHDKRIPYIRLPSSPTAETRRCLAI